MDQGLFSNQWYRVANLCPRVRSNAVTHRHYYRGEPWYIIGAKSSKSHLRVNKSAFYIFTQFDGERTVEAIWKSALSVLKDDAPSQDEVIQLLSSLFDKALIDFQRLTDVDQLFDNHRRKKVQEAKSRYWNPLFLRFSLFDPDRLAQKLLPLCSWVFNRIGLYSWILLLLICGVLVSYSWSDLSDQLGANLVSPTNLAILWFVFPLMKLLHELAHAIAVKRWGGEVHEFGISLLVLLPVPYVDASDSASFGNKYRRMVVAGAGIITESTLACLGLLVWIFVEPGLIREIAFNVMLTGSVSSILFNGNPLLKFDSYYVLSDAIEIPSLASRSNRYLKYLVKRYLFGVQATSPVTAVGERRWFVGYGLLAMGYRLVLTITIALFIASQYFFIGVALAIWALVMQVGVPILRGLKYLVKDASLNQKRLRANAVSLSFATIIIAGLFFVPVPNATQVRGVVWPLDEAMIRIGTDCFVDEVMISNGDIVDVGANLVKCDVTLLQAEVANLRAEQMAARASLYAAKNQVERGLKQTEIDTVTELLSKSEKKFAKTVLQSPLPGVIFAPKSANLVGNHLKQGDLFGYVLSDNNISIRTMLEQERVALLGDQIDKVEVRMVRAPEEVLPSKILRKVPAATERLVTPALGIKGGGDLILSSDDVDGLNLDQPAFEFELQLPTAFQHSLVGEAVEVRFDHGSDSFASLVYRQLQLLLLRRFNV